MRIKGNNKMDIYIFMSVVCLSFILGGMAKESSLKKRHSNIGMRVGYEGYLGDAESYNALNSTDLFMKGDYFFRIVKIGKDKIVHYLYAKVSDDGKTVEISGDMRADDAMHTMLGIYKSTGDKETK